MPKKISLAIVLLVIVAAGVGIWRYAQKSSSKNTLVASVSYLCRDGKTMAADYFKGEQIPVQSGEMPMPSGSVSLKLSDGRSFILPQTISASGIRYANSDESFVFWSKGNGALVLEDNIEKSYIGCVALAENKDNLPNAYVNQEGTFSIRYPAGYTVNDSYIYQALGPGKDIYGVKFTIPASIASGTNLSSYDTGLSVEEIPQIQDCNALLFLSLREGMQSETITDNDVTYSVASGSDAGAGNLYEEKVWAFPGTNPCVAVRYFIHSTNIGNYPEGTVSAFDRNSLITQFDQMRHSLLLAP